MASRMTDLSNLLDLPAVLYSLGLLEAPVPPKKQILTISETYHDK